MQSNTTMNDFTILNKLGKHPHKIIILFNSEAHQMIRLCFWCSIFTTVLIIFSTSLGSGAFSEVYKVQRKSDRKEYALKKVRLSKLTTKEKDNAINEVRILASINHENIAGYKEAFFEQGSSSLCIVMEYANGGDLQSKINQHKKTKAFHAIPALKEQHAQSKQWLT